MPTVAACLTANVIALNNMTWSAFEKGNNALSEQVSNLFYDLKNVACDHTNAPEILRILD